MADKNVENVVRAGVAGVVIGAAAGAAAVLLADKDNRKKVQKTITEAKDVGRKQIDKLGKVVKEAEDKSADILRVVDNTKLVEDDGATKRLS